MRTREAFEVRKSGSLLVTQLRGWDLCRFQGSVRRPEGCQVNSLVCGGDNTSALHFKIQVTIAVRRKGRAKWSLHSFHAPFEYFTCLVFLWLICLIVYKVTIT